MNHSSQKFCLEFARPVVLRLNFSLEVRVECLHLLLAKVFGFSTSIHYFTVVAQIFKRLDFLFSLSRFNNIVRALDHDKVTLKLR